VYSAAKQLLEAFALPSASSFMAVALVEYPRRGAFSLGFISRRIDLNINGEIRKFATVFIPATPTPVTGSAVLVPVDELILVNMTVEEGIKFIVSGGVVSPESIKSVSADAGTKTGEVARETR
ncbi:MAG TPA: DUF502 domain-containing protein, partial [Candidatus Deferrimicrobium sp.]|nr:DUF502 domain-containing protein [Candidatus Deferrimicrobium sp.]